jgi:3-hydroxy-9,10-secoandrosta-1,3,5(10)-triene-9,17-dione monooxygenase
MEAEVQMTEMRLAQVTPTRTELVARAVALQPLLLVHAPHGEVNRRQADEVIKALSAAGFFRLLTPVGFGGYSADLRTIVEITEALGTADGSAAWLVGLGSVVSWLVSGSTARAQQEIFGPDPDARLGGSGHPVPARRVDGGLVVSGRWPYASGSPHATWAALGALVVDDDAHSADVYMCLVPASEVRVEDTWHVVGMRGTGSNTWAAEDLFIPEHRLVSMTAITGFAPIATLALVGPLLGMGLGALSAVIAGAEVKSIHDTVFARQRDSVGVQIQVAEAALAMQTARLHAHNIAERIDEAGAGGEMLTYQDRAQMRGALGYVAQTVLKAIDVLVNVHGAATFDEANPVQRFWRDANTAARHAGLNSMIGYEVLGKSLLGVDEQVSTMV